MHKDEPVDRLLKRASRVRTDRPSGECLDPGTLAMWMEGDLTPHERAAAEAHAADCDRCLSVLAAIARTAPPAASPKPRWYSMRLLVPLASAAVAITAWVLVHDVQDPSRPLPASPPPSQQAKVAEESTISEQPKLAEDAAKVDYAAKAAPKPDLKVGGASAVDTELEKRERPPASPRRREEDFARVPQLPPLKDAAAAPVEDRLEARKTAPAAAAPSQDRVAESPSPPPAPPLPPAQPSTVVEAAPRKPSGEPTRGARADNMVAARQLVLPTLVIPSPDANVQWRVSGTLVERTSDGGRTWREQLRLDAPGVAAGGSPAPGVCWLVGRSGIVLLSTDGEHWRRAATPDPSADLLRVTAQDGNVATVTAADGRTFRTSDGGRSWTPQENPATPF